MGPAPLWRPACEDLAVFRPALVGWKMAIFQRPLTTPGGLGLLLGDHSVTMEYV